MKRHFAAASLLLAAGIAAPAHAQGDEPGQAAAADVYRVDIAVPEAPAFLLTGGDASALLRPSTIRDFSAAFGDFTDEDGRFMLPASFAVEIAPRLLFFGRRLTVQQYAGLPDDIDVPRSVAGAMPTFPSVPAGSLFTRAWSTLRVSLATHRADGQDKPTTVALGVRTSPINGADPRLNTRYRREMRSLLAARNRVNTEIALRRCGITDVLVVPPVDAPPQEHAVDFTAAANVAECLTTQPKNPPADLRDLVALRTAVHDSISAVRKAFAEASWNQQTLEFAGAFSLAARDSTGRSPRPAEYAAWGTYTHPLASWAQGLVGARFRSARDTLTDERGTEWLVGGRLYMGRNAAKALVEAQLPFGDELDVQPYAGLGAEVRILPELWATFSAGLERQGEGRPSRLVTRFSVRSGKPTLQPGPTLSQRTP